MGTRQAFPDGNKRMARFLEQGGVEFRAPTDA